MKRILVPANTQLPFPESVFMPPCPGIVSCKVVVHLLPLENDRHVRLLFFATGLSALFPLKYRGAPFDKRLQTLFHIFAFHDFFHRRINRGLSGFFTLERSQTA